MSEIIEWSDDHKRGNLPHIKATIAHLRGMRAGGAVCFRCQRTATSLIDATQAPRAVCETHAIEWRSLSPMQRMQARTDFARRSR